MWHSKKRRLFRDGLVQDAERLDRSGLQVGQKREDNTLPVGKVFQDCDGIVTNGCKSEPAFAKPLTIFVQLDELTLAERSPVSRAVEDQHRTLRATYIIESASRAELIWQ